MTASRLGKRLVAEVVDVPALGVGGDQRLGDFGQTFLQSNVGGHGERLVGGITGKP